MICDKQFGYAQARIQARHGDRLDEPSWNVLHTSGDLGRFVEAARTTTLRRWVQGLASRPAPPEIESTLHRELVAYIEEVASWVPQSWFSAVCWTAKLLEAEEGWAARWRGLWPRAPRSHSRALARLIATLSEHRDEMLGAELEADGWLVREQLAGKLLRMFRHYLEQPAAVFCHLGLVALDVERLRGALIRRSLFPDVRSARAWV